ncbi:HNH endonuclease [Paenibacillus athensensis]|uniref:Restriction endonuclease n=1 Tax=Paenibacillus athensensis TaxID=1967502 RepID=A0A4Y8Q4Q6_9BACL|nr:HNH endonuclease [Paenibacillus athensensis]MCD1260772.1 HNH endonuclease [Paenibacillus athensensis]
MPQKRKRPLAGPPLEARPVIGNCELCGRAGVATTEHHLTPREYGGALLPTAALCVPCHKQIHALFTNDQLADGLHTLEALRANPDIASFLKWIRKQPPGALPRIRKSNRLKGR